MTPKDWEQQLLRDGYTGVALHKDPPNFEYPEHAHPVDTGYVVLQGEMVVIIEGKDYAVGLGQRLDIGKQVAHQARIGKDGCSFLVGVKM